MSKSICIIGAGPGGAVAALTLAKAGIECTVIDKATFPREKVCGDGFSGWVKVIFDHLDPEYTQELLSLSEIQTTKGAKIFVPNGQHLDFELSPEESSKMGFTLKREVFDNSLIEKLRSNSKINLIEGQEITDLSKNRSGFDLCNRDHSFKLHSNLVIIANGAFSKFAKKTSGIRVNPKQNMICARTYYRNVKEISATDPKLEFYFLKSTLPGYLWIFPEKENVINIGVGYFVHDIQKSKKNPKHLLTEIINKEPLLRNRFIDATQIDTVKSCGLPLGHKKHKLAGDHYMIIGDAAVLANPLTGEGISAAMFSGSIAAKHAINCWQQENFSNSQTIGYQKELYKRLWWEISLSQKLQRLVATPGIMNMAGNKYRKSKTFKELLHACSNNLKPIRKIFNPYYLLKILVNK